MRRMRAPRHEPLPLTENHGVGGDITRLRHTARRLSQYSATAHRVLFRLLMYRELVLVGDGCGVPERKSG
jgi:hypothetical protein